MSVRQLPISVYGSEEARHESQYRSTECILYGSIVNDKKDQMLQRLKGLCEHGGPIPFYEHNMVFKLSMVVLLLKGF